MRSTSALARLQQAATLWLAACALGWAMSWWHREPWVAVLGAAAIAWGHAWVLAVEFMLLRRVAASDPAPVASRAELLRAWLAECVQGVRVFGWRQPWRWRAEPDQLGAGPAAGRHGVVLVHGFVCNRGFWTPWMRRLRGTGRAFVAVNLEPVFTDIDTYVAQLAIAARQVREATGRPPVLVCHSMGGLVARAWLRGRGQEGPADVAQVITIGSPHAGTWLARWSHLPNGRQMRQDSPWIAALARAWTPELATRFTCWYSNADNIVMPPSTACLPGADNRLVRGAAHVDLAFRPQVLEATLARLDQLDAAAAGSRCPGANSGSPRTRS